MRRTAARADALAWIGSGRTSAALTARAASPSRYDAYRTAEGPSALAGPELRHLLPAHLVPGDALAAEMAALDASLAAEVAGLEAAGWTQGKARAALREGGPHGSPQAPMALKPGEPA